MREEYLKIWNKTPYPPVQGEVLGLADLGNLKQGRVRIGARIHQISAQKLLVGWDGKVVELGLSPSLELAPGFQAHEVLITGDIIELRVHKNENRMTLDSLALLVPTMRENPFFELSFSNEMGHKWQEFIQATRDFFKSRDFVELRTPTLVSSPGLEPHLDPFVTQFTMGKYEKKFFLPTSPEFHLKKAITRGFSRCFEFKECFRNGELSEHHQPEFLMLEWYRSFSSMEAMIRDVSELIETLQKSFSDEVRPLAIVTMEQIFKKEFEFDLSPQTTQAEIFKLAQKENLLVSQDESFDDIFMRLFVERIEPRLGKAQPLLLYHFPPSQAALARLTSDGWADRFELFWKGLEIANAFHELNDPHEQKRRFKSDQQKKRELQKEVVPVDEEFIQALEYGMPPSVGIALGVERLFLALFGLKNLSEARLFPFIR